MNKVYMQELLGVTQDEIDTLKIKNAFRYIIKQCAKGVTQHQQAESIGVSQSSMSKVSSNGCTVDKMIEYASKLGVTFDVKSDENSVLIKLEMKK